MSEITGKPAPALKIGSGAVNRYFRLKQRARSLFPAGGSDSDPARLAGKYYFYNNESSRLALRLRPARPIGESLKDAYDWLKGENA